MSKFLDETGLARVRDWVKSLIPAKLSDLTNDTGFITAAQAGAGSMVGATENAAGTEGLVPAPAAGDQNAVLIGSGAWARFGKISQVTPYKSAHTLTLNSRGLITIDVPKPPILDKLWENSTHGTFAAQTLSISECADYDVFLIQSYDFDTSDYYTSEFVFKGNIGSHIHCWATTSNNRNGQRAVEISDTGITFSSCTYNGGTNNKYCVPMVIYGVRNITFAA